METSSRRAPLPYLESHSALRGIAAFTVVMSHLSGLTLAPRRGPMGHLLQVFSWNQVAVFLFFILSGFVMSYVYSSPVHWRHFLVARLARLVPVYEIVLVSLCLVLAARHAFTSSAANLFANVLMVQEWFPAHGLNPINGPSWSLSVEVFLYIFLLPLLVWTRGFFGNKILYSLLVVSGSLWGTLFYNYYSASLFHVWYLPLLSGASGFSVGFALQNLLPKDGVRFSPFLGLLGVALISFGISGRIVSPLDANGWSLHQSLGPLVPGLILLVVASIDRNSLPYKWLSLPIFLFMGDISYSLYLWHYPIFELVRSWRDSEIIGIADARTVLVIRTLSALFALGSVLIFATISYYRIEVPCRRLIRDRFVRPRAGASG